MELDVPRDRNNEFEPKLVAKHQRDISGIEEKVISLYSRGMSTRDIHDQLQDIRKITKTKSTLPNGTSLEKILYLASQNVIKKWTQRYRNWDLVLSQLIILYGDRLNRFL